jgi:methionyl aminopeptidase
MSITSQAEFVALKEAGRVCRLVLAEMQKAVRPDVTTAELGELAAKTMKDHGAQSAPELVYGFPGSVCISVNDEVVHGIPSTKVVRPGDLVKLDVTVEKDGYMADAAITVLVEPVSDEARRLANCVERAFHQAMGVARAHHRVSEIGRAVEEEVRRWGFSVIRALGGHGIGRTIHEAPSVPNYDDPLARQRLTPGLVITVEPIITVGKGVSYRASDGWTERTVDGSLSAHFEHTIVVTSGAPILLTAAA